MSNDVAVTDSFAVALNAVSPKILSYAEIRASKHYMSPKIFFRLMGWDFHGDKQNIGFFYINPQGKVRGRSYTVQGIHTCLSSKLHKEALVDSGEGVEYPMEAMHTEIVNYIEKLPSISLKVVPD